MDGRSSRNDRTLKVIIDTIKQYDSGIKSGMRKDAMRSKLGISSFTTVKAWKAKVLELEELGLINEYKDMTLNSICYLVKKKKAVLSEKCETEQKTEPNVYFENKVLEILCNMQKMITILYKELI